MKKPKKIIFLCIALSTVISGFVLPVKGVDGGETRTNDLDLYVSVIADMHVSATSDGEVFGNVVNNGEGVQVQILQLQV